MGDDRALATRLCQPYAVHWWGSEHTVTPVFVRKVFGDGQQLLGLQPLNTRPQYYIVRIDSTWDLQDDICDHLDAIYDAIEDEYGANHDEEDAPVQDWPALDLDAGSTWFPLDPPAATDPT